jgi:hypothetical protein
LFMLILQESTRLKYVAYLNMQYTTP